MSRRNRSQLLLQKSKMRAKLLNALTEMTQCETLQCNAGTAGRQVNDQFWAWSQAIRTEPKARFLFPVTTPKTRR